MHVALPTCAFIAAGLVLVPLPWHWRARNVATLSLIPWLLVSNVIFAINSIIWSGNVTNSAPVWCDISTKLEIGANMALPACCLCICIHLERIASVRQVCTAHSDKIRRMIFDAALCWGIPMVYMALHYIVQGHRFDIIEDFGCRPTVYVSLPAVFLIWVPPLIVSFATLGFSAMALRHFFRRRLMFAKHLQNSNSGLNTAHYFRLMVMAIVEMIWALLVTSLNMWFSCQHGLRPWISWQNVHSGFSQIAYFPTAIIPPSTLAWTYVLWTVVPMSAVLFSAFFSFGEEAVKEYQKCFLWVCAIANMRPTPVERINKIHISHGQRDESSFQKQSQVSGSFLTSSGSITEGTFDTYSGTSFPISVRSPSSFLPQSTPPSGHLDERFSHSMA